MNVVIITEPDDIHAVLVKLALEKKGVKCELHFTADMPTKQQNNILFSDNKWMWESYSLETKEIHHYQNTDVVWWRRARRPFLPDVIHPDDRSFAQEENLVYHHSIPFLFDERAWWVNPIASQQKTKSKITQLKLASQCGFKLPETLISNAPKEIKQFIQSRKEKSVIYKSFYPQYWAEKDSMRMLYTNHISFDDLPSDNLLQAAPGIYQEYVEKKYELRVTCFGSYLSAVKISSQDHALGQTDWRRIPGSELSPSEVQLPNAIQEKIQIFMKKIGVVFGCFDFIVTPENEFIFLEINEQGQFLWIEQLSPSLLYLDIFSEFLINRKYNFTWKKRVNSISSSDFNEEAMSLIRINKKKHIDLNKVRIN